MSKSVAEKNKEYQARWYEANKERIKEVRRVRSQQQYINNPTERLWSAAKLRAKQQGLDFNIEVSDIIIPDVCPILKQPLIRKTRHPPSLDRIDPSKGYIKGNVWVISRKANVMKNDATINELKEFARWVKNL